MTGSCVGGGFLHLILSWIHIVWYESFCISQEVYPGEKIIQRCVRSFNSFHKSSSNKIFINRISSLENILLLEIDLILTFNHCMKFELFISNVGYLYLLLLFTDCLKSGWNKCKCNEMLRAGHIFPLSYLYFWKYRCTPQW